MPFIRLSDNYIDHPKFLALSASAFRLWHEGMAFCRKHQTDGLIPMGALQGFRYYKPPRATELATPYQPGHQPLWERIDGLGFKVHDYLDWNLSKEEEQSERTGAAARMRKWRSAAPVTPLVTRNADRNERVTGGVTNAFVPDRIGLREEGGTGGSDHPVAKFIQETYPTVYAKCRHGATFRVSEARDFEVCRDLVDTYGERVGLLLEYFLQLPPGKDVLNQPGTPRQFKHMAPTCDSELRKHGR